MKILGANPLLADAPAFPVARGIVTFPRKPIAAAGHIHNATPQTLETATYTSNATWRSPDTTSRIVTMSGWGGSGTPEQFTEDWYYSYNVVTYSNGAQETNWDYSYRAGLAPSDTCTYYDGSNTTIYIKSVCTYYMQVNAQYIPAQYGGDTTAFGKVFLGGYGSGITIQNVTEPVDILPATDYVIVIPSGGRLDFSFYK